MVRHRSSYLPQWEPGDPVVKIEQVWQYLSTKLKALRQSTHKLRREYYGYQRPESFHKDWCEYFNAHPGRHDNGVLFLSRGDNPKQCDDKMTKLCLMKKNVLGLLSWCNKEVLIALRAYCSDYQALGISDDRLFVTYRAKMKVVGNLQTQLNRLMSESSIEQLGQSMLTDFMQCSCGHEHWITYLMPEALEILDQLLDGAFDWLMADRMYVNELRAMLSNTHKQLRDVEQKYTMAKTVYLNTLGAMKQEKLSLESTTQAIDVCRKRNLRQADKSQRYLKLEIVALEKAIGSIQTDVWDQPDCFVDEPEMLSETTPNDLIYYKQRLRSKQEELDAVVQLLEEYNSLREERSKISSEIKQLAKKTTKSRRQRDKLAELRGACYDKLSMMQGILDRREKPSTKLLHLD